MVLLIQVLLFVINAVGAKTINEVLWQFSARLPLSSSKDAQDQRQLRNEVLRLKKEMNAISAQDNFAKWAKVRREHDKAMAAHDQKASDVSAHRNSFDTKANAARWVMTSGMQMFLQFWHAKTPVFTYPRGWLPWPVEWILGFPRCPYGAVSINVWSMTCGTVIALIGNGLLGIVQGQPAAAGVGKQKVAMGAEKQKS